MNTSVKKLVCILVVSDLMLATVILKTQNNRCQCKHMASSDSANKKLDSKNPPKLKELWRCGVY